MASNQEQLIQQALNDLDIGAEKSIRKVAAKYRVSKTTVAYRRRGRNPRTQANRRTQRLSLEEEKTLIQWIRDLQRQNLCPNYPRIRSFVYEILRNRGDSRPLGKNYVSRFISRHSELRTSRSRAMDIKRLSALDPTVIESFFSEFEQLRSQYGVEIENIWNMDETGFQMGQTTSNFVAYDASIGRPVAPQPDNTQWVTIIECISYHRALKPYLIFCGKAPELHMFPAIDELPDIIWAFSLKGWTDNELGIDWLRRIFIPQRPIGKHSILILDGHDSHSTGLFQYLCLQNDIHPLYLPAHASHKLQPLDLGPFSPLKAAYGQLVQRFALTGLATLNRRVFTKLYIEARQTTFTERNIRAGWHRTGIWPLNKQKLLNDPEIRNFGRTTPEYQPPATSDGLYSTPKQSDNLRALIRQIEAKTTPQTRRAVRKLGHSAIQEHTGAQLLRTQLRELRQLALKQELTKRSKRIQKETKQRSWNLEQVRAALAPKKVHFVRKEGGEKRILRTVTLE
ncbi:hypothetical protein EPUS_02181 [Endocarpon pusillum Z07020]|uniref:HTH CENPB-type domain-containing protein n=1 Tax=Endocarpon pusillum (strain Z07020 / HMAS-L-300199) TaxID=1263415 RepID=U1HJW1_ENDPU|nr:uncharacterized protein EPUS_02181 [Endocarpon pusillum Z07020]XP_007805274.1 uncharacterized protein EPUS_01171 [Endocarpon pusillum Z07020]ERF69214.1 hypothetical protein EPUS_01171 [Endocarpon pusillum Z07020]ERF72294.1 hypothetical protein EPUS_02181 [Endocarpon pusillum Z07020]